MNRIDMAGYAARAIGAALVGTLLGSCATAPKSGLPARSVAGGPQTLRIATDSDITSLDPHAFFIDTNLNVIFQIYDSLLRFGPGKELRPSLAEGCTQQRTDKKVWVCKLRAGVRFHDGSPFDKKDALASIKRVLDIASDARSQFIQNVDKIDLPATVALNAQEPDPLRLVIKTQAPFRFLPHGLAAISILREQNALEAQAIGKRSGLAAAAALFRNPSFAVGTGPYKLVGWLPFDPSAPGQQARAELVRASNEAVWENVQYLPMPNEADRVRAVRDGKADVAVNSIAPSGMKALKTPGLRVMHLQLFQGGDDRETRRKDGATFHKPVQDSTGNVYPNPFVSREFRRALAFAVDRERLVRVVDGLGEPTNQYMRLGKPGHVADPFTYGSYSLEKARRHLLNAVRERGDGHPDLSYLAEKAVTIPLNGPKGRYRNDERVLQELASIWTEAFTFERDGKKVAIRFEPHTEPPADYFGVGDHAKWYLTVLLGGGVDNGHGEAAIRLYLLKKSALNHVRYSHPKIDELYERASTDMNAARSDRDFTRALKLALFEEQAMIPLFRSVEAWTVRDGICFSPREDGLTLARDIVSGTNCGAEAH